MKIVTIDTFRTLITTHPKLKYGRIAALDVGTKRIGVASTDEIRFTISPLITIERKVPRMEKTSLEKLSRQFQTIINENHITGIIVGFPLNRESEITPLCREIVNICREVSCQYKSLIPDPPTGSSTAEEKEIICTFWDERSSTVGSRALAKEMSDKLRVVKKYKDTFAATLILRGFMDNILHHKP